MSKSELIVARRYRIERCDDVGDPVAVRFAHVNKNFRVYRSEGERVLSLISRGHRRAMRRVVAAKDISFEIKRGQRVQFFGDSGSGCSTMCALIRGSKLPSSGFIQVNGEVAVQRPAAGILIKKFTGNYNLMLICRQMGLDKIQAQAVAAAAAEFSELGKRLDQPLNSLNKALQERLIPSVLVQLHPQILVMDGRVSMIDKDFLEKYRKAMQKAVEECATTVIFAGRKAATADLADRVIGLRRGEVVFDDTPAKYKKLHKERRDRSPISSQELALERARSDKLSELTRTVAEQGIFAGGGQAVLVPALGLGHACAGTYLAGVLRVPLLALPQSLTGPSTAKTSKKAKPVKAQQAQREVQTKRLAAVLAELSINQGLVVAPPELLGTPALDCLALPQYERICAQGVTETAVAAIAYLTSQDAAKRWNLEHPDTLALNCPDQGPQLAPIKTLLIGRWPDNPSRPALCALSALLQWPLLTVGGPGSKYVFPEILRALAADPLGAGIEQVFLCGGQDQVSGPDTYHLGVGSTEDALRQCLPSARLERIEDDAVERFVSDRITQAGIDQMGRAYFDYIKAAIAILVTPPDDDYAA
ncbi:MAG: ATP-binding cassette domain-containing protein [Coriobacteriales bacterium]|jgi:teichoic acid transport system ATP-binding protein|nr:ATP-binding cassette domain-containing protein [Coriobacteriales bacterium]